MRALAMFAPLLALAGCGGAEETPDATAQGNGMALQDLSNVAAVDGVRPDAKVIRDRRVQGTWTGRMGDASAELSLGGDGKASVRLMRGGSVAESASGTWRWRDDGRIDGTLSSAAGGLSGFSTWTGTFPRANSIRATGADGATMDFSRTMTTGARTPQEAYEIYRRRKAQEAGR